MSHNVVALVLAGGSSKRFAGHYKSKLHELIDGHTVLYHSVRTLYQHPMIDCVHVVINPSYESDFIAIKNDFPSIKFIPGGESRMHSVKNGLQHLAQYKNVRDVLIHDAARPFLKHDLITKVIEALDDNEAVDVLIQAVDTIKQFQDNKFISHTRKNLYQTQTPQGFRLQMISQLYQANECTDFTDDISLCMHHHIKIATVQGHPSNYKITFPGDI